MIGLRLIRPALPLPSQRGHPCLQARRMYGGADHQGRGRGEGGGAALRRWMVAVQRPKGGRARPLAFTLRVGQSVGAERHTQRVSYCVCPIVCVLLCVSRSPASCGRTRGSRRGRLHVGPWHAWHAVGPQASGSSRSTEGTQVVAIKAHARCPLLLPTGLYAWPSPYAWRCGPHEGGGARTCIYSSEGHHPNDERLGFSEVGPPPPGVA